MILKSLKDRIDTLRIQNKDESSNRTFNSVDFLPSSLRITKWSFGYLVWMALWINSICWSEENMQNKKQNFMLNKVFSKTANLAQWSHPVLSNPQYI